MLDVATGWQSSHLRHTAITRLGLFHLPLLLRLQYALQHHIDDWLQEIYRDLCLQRKPIERAIVQLLPPDVITSLWAARDALRNEFIRVYQDYRPGCGAHGSAIGGTTTVIYRALDGSVAAEDYVTILDAFDAFFHDGSRCNRAGHHSSRGHAGVMKEHATRLVLEHIFPTVQPVLGLD